MQAKLRELGSITPCRSWVSWDLSLLSPPGVARSRSRSRVLLQAQTHCPPGSRCWREAAAHRTRERGQRYTRIDSAPDSRPRLKLEPCAALEHTADSFRQDRQASQAPRFRLSGCSGVRLRSSALLWATGQTQRRRGQA